MFGDSRRHRFYAAAVALAAVIGTSATFVSVAEATQATQAATGGTAATSTSGTTGNTGSSETTGDTGTADGQSSAPVSGGTAPTTTTTTPTTTTTVAAGNDPVAPSSSNTTPPPAPVLRGASSGSGDPGTAKADPSSVVDGTVTWTGNGTTNGQCGSSENLGLTVPPGQQAWLFILTSPGTGPFELTTNLGDVSGTQMGDGSVHFILFTPLDATLTSASAVTGTAHSVLTVSGCQFGTPLISGSTTSTTVFDATSGAPWSSTEAVGATAYDTDTVTPTTPGGPTPTGTVTYTFFTNGSCDGPGTSQTVTLNGDGTVPHSSTSLPLAAGDYSYDAVYNGDTNYSASGVSSCEPFSVAETTPTITTVVFDGATIAPWAATEKAGATSFDTSTLSDLFVGFAPTGTVTYTFFPNGTCTAPGTVETVTITAGVVPNSPRSLPLPAGSYSYDAVYNGDGNYNPSAVSVCEPFSVAPTTSPSSTSGSTTTGTSLVTTSPSITGAVSRPAAPAASVAGSALAFTGSDLFAMFAAGLALTAAGSALVLESRRRRRRRA